MDDKKGAQTMDNQKKQERRESWAPRREAPGAAAPQTQNTMPHTLILQQRGSLSVTGVRRVLHCDETSAALETSDGTLHLVGAQLSVTALDLDVGEASLSGRIDALEYTENRTPGGLWHRLLR
jgi:sporulation protein YabP